MSSRNLPQKYQVENGLVRDWRRSKRDRGKPAAARAPAGCWQTSRSRPDRRFGFANSISSECQVVRDYVSTAHPRPALPIYAYELVLHSYSNKLMSNTQFGFTHGSSVIDTGVDLRVGCMRPLCLFYLDASADGVEERSLVSSSRSHARLKRNATMSHVFSCVQLAFIDA
ncbi:hypothetical protein EVAR_16537_1 [Eumeta japonica]|uniref:Uncharacterized protein n=1 Tax=Eumeta variegata TaxID=151549 RepID=A0A4C1U3M8_EUMVA|nr:hypothetical protein EVAR_16537_1 [Eumeta japonica]